LLLPDLMLGSTALLLERYLDILAARQRVTSANVANADTPGYRAREVDFRSEMQSFLNGGARGPFPAVTASERWGEGAKNDGNNVSLDREMQALAENGMRFSLASLLLQKQIRGVRNAIREGRG